MERFKLNRNQLKALATIFMVFDNIYLRFAGLPSIIHLLTRFVAPLFAWLMVEGFFHTHSRKEYCKRLWIAAVLMQIGDFISLALLKEKGISDNIFLTLAISFSVIWLIDTAKKAKGNKKILLNLGAVALAAVGMVISEGGLSIIPFVFITYLFYHQKTKQAVVYFLYCFILFFTLYGGLSLAIKQGLEMFCVNSDWMGFLVIPFMYLYNGEKGQSRPYQKWFFYVFYPLHLWILAIISVVIK